MEKIIIITLAILATLFLIIKHNKRKKKRNIIKEELNKILNVREKALEELVFYAYFNQERFYKKEDFEKIEKTRNQIDELNQKMKKFDEKYSKDKKREIIEEAISGSKNEDEVCLDPLGMNTRGLQVVLDLTVAEESLNMSLSITKLTLLFFYFIFSKIIPEFQDDKELVEKCEVFLKYELESCILAKKVKMSDKILNNFYLDTAKIIIKKIKSDKILLISIQLNSFFK
jgi:hypothetical protein